MRIGEIGHPLNTLVVSDWLDYIQTVPDESVDLVLTDPAYESMRRWEGVGTTARMGMGKEGSGSDNEEDKFFPTIPNEDIPDLVQHIYRVLRPGRHAYIMCDEITERLIYRYAIEERVFTPTDDYGTEPYRRLVLDEWDDENPLSHYRLIVWDKMAPGMVYSYRRQYEFIVMLWKGEKVRRDGTRRGKRRLNSNSIPDVLRFKRIPPTQALVPTQKPVELFELLIGQSTFPLEVVMDPFMGSGTTAVAALRQGRNWTGCELLQKHADKANFRIAHEKRNEAPASQLGLLDMQAVSL